MKRNDDEIIEGDASTRKSWLILAFIYVLFLIWLEPSIDYLMSLFPPDKDFSAIEIFNKQKNYITVIAFAVARMFPMGLFFLLGYRSIITGQFPPRKMSMPITVRVMKGPRAKMLAMLVIVLASLLLFKEIVLVVNTKLVMS